jgi:hypothetical protein
VVSSEMEVEPGGCLIEFPHAGWNASSSQLGPLTSGGEPIVGPHPDARPVRVDLASAMPTASARPVPDMFGALGLGAEECQVLNPAIPAPKAGE